MSKRRNLFKDVKKDTAEIRASIFREAYKINNFNSCPKKDHKNNEHNPWCLHGLGQEVWFDTSNAADDEEDHFTVRPKYLGRYSGLRNLGATCYVNSLTQILYHNKKFRNALYSFSPPDDETGEVIRTLQRVLVDLEYSSHGVVDTTGLVSSLQLPTTEQQDVVEFGELLFGLLNNSIPNLQDNCKGKGSYITRCLTCGNVTTRTSDFTDLKLQVQPRNKTLAERIQQLSSVEILEGENSYHCSRCDALRRVERCYVVNQYPETLHLQLLRFNYNTSTMQRTKDTSYVKFDDVLTLFNLAGDSGHTSKTYKLTGIIIHVGETTQSGHYIAVIRRGEKWVTFNDEVVTELDKLDLRQYDLSSARRPGCSAREFCSQSVYMLVYQDVSEQHVSVPIVTPVSLMQPSSNTAQPYSNTAQPSSNTLQPYSNPAQHSSHPAPRITDYFNRSASNSDNTVTNSDNTRSVADSDNRVPDQNGVLTSSSTVNLDTAAESDVTPDTSAQDVSPPGDVLSAIVAENVEFEQLRELLLEQRKDVVSSKEEKVATMREACCKISPENETCFLPVPSKILRAWLKSGVTQQLNPDPNPSSTSGAASSSTPSSEVRIIEKPAGLEEYLCQHSKLSYHQLKQIKYVERDVIRLIVEEGGERGREEGGEDLKSGNRDEECCQGVKTENSEVPELVKSEIFNHEDCGAKPKIEAEEKLKETKLVEIKNKSLSLENLVLCEDCVISDLKRHLYELALEEDFKKMGVVQNRDPESGWWVLKDDFRNFKKLVRQGGLFNKEVECRHSALDPDPKRRKLVSYDVKTIITKYFPQFPAPSHLETPCQVCADEGDTEKLYITSLLQLKRDIQRLLTDGAFPYIPSLTPFLIPTSFIRYDLRPFYRKKIQDRISLDNSVLICKHSLLASDALEHAAFVKESEWNVLLNHFGPTTTIRCDSNEGAIIYSPALCRECVMLHDVFTDQVVYLREDKTAGKRGRRGDKILRLSSYDTVRDVKIQICEKMAIAPSEQTLRAQNGKLLDSGTMRELGVVPNSVIYLEYNHALLQETEVFNTATEQGFKGTVLSGR